MLESVSQSVSDCEFINNNSSESKSNADGMVIPGGNDSRSDIEGNKDSTRVEQTESVVMVDQKENNQVLKLENSQYVCLWNFCKKEFNSMDSFVEHVDNHVGNQPWICQWSNCEKSAQKYIFGKKFKLKHHLRKSSPNV